MARYSTRTFAVLRQVKADVDAIRETIPELKTGRPVVDFGDPEENPEHNEVIWIVLRNRGNEMGWERTSPPGRDETFVIEIVVGTFVRGRTGAQVVDRLEEVTAVIENIWHDTTTETFTPPAVDGIAALGGIEGVDVDIFDGTEGKVGQSTINMRIVARI